MCIHDKNDLRDSIAGSAHALRTSDPYTVVWWEGPGDKVYGVDCIDPRNTKEIANAIRNIRSWHREIKGWTLHLEHVNLQRWMLGLPPVTQDGLPAPTGEAPPSRDAVEA